MATPHARLALYEACRGDQEHPICNLCGAPVTPGQAWDESHIGAPKALGGNTVGIAHRKCNRDHGAKVVVPMVAKVKRIRRNHIGAKEHGRGWLCGRNSKWKRKISGEVVAR